MTRRRTDLDIVAYNRERWNRQVALGNPWTRPVDAATIAAAREGRFSVLLTEQITVPRDWFPADLRGCRLLCLACGGGQQGPTFAAAGAAVTVFDLSPAQLQQDRLVATREGLELRTVEGDMRDLSAFADGSFDLVFHPVSNLFCPEVRPVWREVARVLRPGGELLAGFRNPDYYIWERSASGGFELRYRLPFDPRREDPAAMQAMFGDDSPWEFSHSLTDLIGGQLAAGLRLVDLYEDTQPDPPGDYLPAYLATRAAKPV
ncbi:MAG: methyltransferase domain-containing protein [Fimbriimonadaceae bacterium]|nr:methyltransferase domain-containing protein [Fimbriimonadaceae bacterium]